MHVAWQIDRRRQPRNLEIFATPPSPIPHFDPLFLHCHLYVSPFYISIHRLFVVFWSSILYSLARCLIPLGADTLLVAASPDTLAA